MVGFLLSALLVAISAAWYNILLKKASERFLYSFWVAFFTFVNMTILFYTKHLMQGMTFSQTSLYIHSLVTTNTPFFFTVAFLILLQIACKSYMFGRHAVGKIVPILEIGTPLTAFLYYLLGNHITGIQAVGIGTIALGAMISGFKTLEFPNIFKPLLHLHPAIYVYGIAMAFLATSENLCIYLMTKATPVTTMLTTKIQSLPFLSHFHFSFMSPLEYFEIASIFFVTGFFVYLLGFTRHTLSSMLAFLKQEKRMIFVGACANTFSQYVYYYIYEGNKQSIVVALTKFGIPLTLMFAYLTLKDRILLPEKVGVTLIVVGGILTSL